MIDSGQSECLDRFRGVELGNNSSLLPTIKSCMHFPYTPQRLLNASIPTSYQKGSSDSLHEYTGPKKFPPSGATHVKMAGSASMSEATERVCQVASEDPLLDQTLQDTHTQVCSFTRQRKARALSCCEVCMFE